MMKMLEFEKHETLGAPMHVARSGMGVENPDLVKTLGEALYYFFNTVMPENEGVAWDCLKVEIWSDSGSFYIFPWVYGKDERIEKSGMHLILQDLEDRFSSWWSNAPDDDEIDEEMESEFEEEMERLQIVVARETLKALKMSETLCERFDDTGIIFFDSDSPEPLLEHRGS